MKEYYGFNLGMSQYIKKLKEAQTIAAKVDPNDITNTIFLCLGLDAVNAAEVSLSPERKSGQKFRLIAEIGHVFKHTLSK